MASVVRSIGILGLEGYLVNVEVSVYNGVRHFLQRQGEKTSVYAGLRRRRCIWCQSLNTTGTTRPSRVCV